MTDRPNAASSTTEAGHVSVVVAHRGTILLTAAPEPCADPDWGVPGADLAPGEPITDGANRVMALLRPGGPQIEWAHLGAAQVVLRDGRDVRSVVVLGYVDARAGVAEDLPARLWRTPLGGRPICPGIDQVLASARPHHRGASALFWSAVGNLIVQIEHDHNPDTAQVPPRNPVWLQRHREAAGRRFRLATDLDGVQQPT